MPTNERRCEHCNKPLTVRQARFCSQTCAWRARHKLKECGTASAIRRHYKRGEPLDDRCKRARLFIDRENRAKRRQRRGLA